jgi:hypothetical protein
MYLGVDRGSVTTKTVDIILKSIVREVKSDREIVGLERIGTPMQINGKGYVFGESGDFTLDMAKGEDINTKLLIYVAIVMSKPKPKEKVDLVVGLPFGQYTAQKDTLVELLESSKPIAYKYDKTESQFSLNQIQVFPEGAGVFYSQNTAKYEGRKVMVVDIGGVSVDVAVFKNRKLDSFSSYPLGVMKLFSKMSTEINNLHKTEYTEWDMDTILKDGLVVDGKNIRNDFLDEFKLDHSKAIFQKIKREYDIRSMDEVQ